MPKQCINCVYYKNDYCYYPPFIYVPPKYKARFHNCSSYEHKEKNKLRDEKKVDLQKETNI